MAWHYSDPEITQAKERGILRLEPRTRDRTELTPQGSYELVPSSPQPSVDRLCVTWADPSMASTGVNLFHLPSETPVTNDVKFTSAGDVSEDEDYSASLSAVLRQRRCSIRRSRKGRRRTSSPFLPDETRSRRRSSVFTTSSGETAISMEDQAAVTQEEIFKNIRMHKEVLSSVKQQPLDLRRKLKLVHLAKGYIKRHEGQLQERLAQSKNTRDIYARFNILLASKWHQLKREAANTSNLLIPWELRIKEIESHFGSVVASYFTFLRWLFWVNLVIGFILFVFVIIPEYLTADRAKDGERKDLRPEDWINATNLLTLWEFEGILKKSPIFYGYYSSIERPQYRMPLAYFLTGIVVYIYSFVAILRKMAENSRMSKLSEKEDECIFSWKLFTGWDYMIGNAETAHNRAASVILGFKEALLEEAEKKKDVRNWRIISLRVFVNLCVMVLLILSVYAVISVVSNEPKKPGSWLHENLTTIVVTLISMLFPIFFEVLGYLEHYHPRRQLRVQLGRIMILNLLNLFSLIFALFSKIQGMSKELEDLKPILKENSTTLNNTLGINETIAITVSIICSEVPINCLPCDMFFAVPTIAAATKLTAIHTIAKKIKVNAANNSKLNNQPYTQRRDANNNNDPYIKAHEPSNIILAESLIQNDSTDITTIDYIKKLEEQFQFDEHDNSSEAYNSSDDIEVDYYDIDITTTESSYENNPKWTDKDYTSSENYGTNSIYTTDFTDISTKDASTAESGTTSNITDDTFDWNATVRTITAETAEETTAIVRDSTISDSTSSWADFTYSFDETLNENTTDTYSTNPSDATETITIVTAEETVTPQTTITVKFCPNKINCTMKCAERNITQVIFMTNSCKVTNKQCFATTFKPKNYMKNGAIRNNTNVTEIDVVYYDEDNRTMYNLSAKTHSKLSKLCWETMFGQELVKLTMMDLVILVLSTLFMDFFRALFVKYFNNCWCWDLEKKCPQYGDFKIAENILHLINNQGMVWMGMFFSPGLVVLNVIKLVIMMYLRSWAVMTCNVPHEVVFRVSKSNNFYLGLLLTMLFLCVLPVGYSIVWLKPSWHCGPFSEHEKIYAILTKNLYSVLPKSLNFAIEYIASPAIIIPLLVLLVLIIYYLISLTNSLREANNDLKIQLHRERTEERRKMLQLVDTRRRGQSALDNTPFARWKKALPGLPLGKSIDSDDRKTGTGDDKGPQRPVKKKGSFLANLVGQVVDKKSEISELDDPSPSPYNGDETDTDFHETLPKEVLKIKDITIIKPNAELNLKKQNSDAQANANLKVKLDKEDRTEKDAVEIRNNATKSRFTTSQVAEVNERKINKKQPSETSTISKQSDTASVIPVITISTTESDEDFLRAKDKGHEKQGTSSSKTTDVKSLRRQSSVDSSNDQKIEKQKPDNGHKYSL